MGSLKKPLGNWVISDHYEYQILVVRGGCHAHQRIDISTATTLLQIYFRAHYTVG